MKTDRFCFLSPGPTSVLIAEAASGLFSEVTLVTDAPHLTLEDVASPFNQTELSIEAAVIDATHIFFESNCSRSLTLLQQALPHLSDEAVICDLLPVKATFVGFLRQHGEASTPYLGAHWLRPSTNTTHHFGVVSEEEHSVEGLRQAFPDLMALFEDVAEQLEVYTIAEHDRLVAEHIQVPGLLYGSAEDERDEVSWGCSCDLRNHPGLQYDALISNQSRILDTLSASKSTIQRIQNHLIAEDEPFFERME